MHFKKDYAKLNLYKVKNKQEKQKMADKKQAKSSVLDQVAERIRSCDNVLVALSKDPSVDELSAALGLTFILDKMGKHATAIFSGAVPNAIEFLEPEKTFETNTNSLQDFIIALDKEKADHLRYKIDGDYVKVYITPYKTTIEESDMEFSHGDYNVDLVIALNVANAGDLDSALTEYGRIMHDASSINIQADVAGNFADLEWGDPNSSSVSEMIYRLSDKLREEGEKSLIDKPIATARLAGIVAATNRFSNEHTQPETMAAASKLMMAGADQQLISSSIPVDILTSDVVDANEDAKEPEPEPEKVPEQKIEHNKSEKKSDNKKSEEKPAENKKIEEELEDLENIEATGSTEEKKEEPAPESAPEPAEEPAPAQNDKPEPIPEVEPEPEKPVDPTALDIRHGAVDFELDENGEEKITVPEPEPAEEPAPAPAPEPEPIPEPAPAPAPEPEPVPEPVIPAAPVAPVLPPVPEAPAAPAMPEMPAASSVIIEPDVSPAAQEKQNHVAEPLSEEDYNAEDHSAENAIDAALQKAAEAARQNEVASAAEAAQATAQLNQMVAANTAAQPATPVMQELAQTTNGIKNLVPPSEAMQPPKIPKDYSAMMNEALAEPIPAPAPAATPVAMPVESAPMMAPTMPASMAAPAAPAPASAPAPAAAPAPAPVAPPTDVAPVEFANPLPMPDPNGILPPPPVPFTPEAGQVANPAELPTAQAFAEQIQANNPAVQSVPAAPAAPAPTMPAPVVSEPAVTPIMPAVPEEAPTLSNGGMAASPAVQGVNPVMQDQIYPADPSAFHIPGM